MPGQGDNVVRLGCAEQAAIAEDLRRHWQHIIDEGVPEHLREFVLRFAEAIDRRGAGAGLAADQGAQAAESGVVVVADFRRGDCK
jgi:hypothetical protein